MVANLSIVLDKDKKIKLDLFKDVELSEIDKYTTQFNNSEEIRKNYNDTITKFLNDNKDFISSFKKGANKRGSLVIVYEDETSKMHLMRVLYKENIKKVDAQSLSKSVYKAIINAEDLNFTLELMKYFDFFLGSEFNKKEMYRIRMHKSNDPTSSKKFNKKLVSLIKSKVSTDLENNYEKGYFYLRLIDAYVEKKGIITTPRVLTTTSGKILVRNIPTIKTNLIKDDKTSKRVVPELDIDKGIFLEEEDGQLSFIKNTENNKKRSNKSSYSFSDYKYDYMFGNIDREFRKK